MFGSKRQPGKGYLLSVRRRGVFKPVGVVKGLNKAFGKGQSIVSNTAAASFKIEPLGRNEKINPIMGFSKKQLYRSRKEKNVFIERRGQRIKTAGEKGEITQKGLFAIRAKKKAFSIF